MLPFVIIVHDEQRPWLTLRTERCLRRLGLNAEAMARYSCARSSGLQTESIERRCSGRPVWLLAAGACPAASALRPPPPSATGRALLAVGAAVQTAFGDTGDGAVQAWREILRESRGDLAGFVHRGGSVTPVLSCWLDQQLARRLPDLLQRRLTPDELWRELCFGDDVRLAVWSGLNVGMDVRLRVAQVITSLQRGGAERLALDLHSEWLADTELNPLLLSLAAPGRTAFPVPDRCLVLPPQPARCERVPAAVKVLERYCVDLVHCHLLDQSELRQLATLEVPRMLTVHNARQGWTSGTESLTSEDVSLLIGCSMCVTEELRQCAGRVPVRTIWNGIRESSGALSRQAAGERNAREQAGRQKLRRELAIPLDAIVLVAVANIRPQKRLERLPAVLGALQALLKQEAEDRPVHLILAGERSSQHEQSMQAEALLDSAITEYAVAECVHRIGSVEDTRALLSCCDALVSVSDYEGLSLVHLEALAAGIPVIATAVGGTPEIAAASPAVEVLPPEVTAAEFAETVWRVLKKSGCMAIRLPEVFSLRAMSERYRQFFPRLAGCDVRQACRGLLLVINNLSTGGAQTSARRLLKELRRRGVPVRAVVLQEVPEYPTPGRLDLLAVGIPVMVLPLAGRTASLAAMHPLLLELDREQPAAVAFWNVMPAVKMLLADALPGIHMFDVSPGEMNFESLERYFARPRADLPIRSSRDYGRLLAGAVVKYGRQRAVAAAQLQTEVHVIPNGVDLPARVREHGPRERVIFGTSARISPQKKLEQLLGALRLALPQLPDCELWIAGAPDRDCEAYAQDLQRLAAGLPVIWLGEVQDIGSLLQQLDVFVMISHPAGCPNASLEALAAGLPVIATDYGGVHEQVLDGVNGKLVPDGAESELASAMILLAQDAALRSEWGRNARTHAEAHFRMDRMVAGYVEALGL
ncbi:MAG: glycosyltransferase [Planctomyces sp.]|nr:glycosyltransferase [Planctomyces sp.]